MLFSVYYSESPVPQIQGTRVMGLSIEINMTNKTQDDILFMCKIILGLKKIEMETLIPLLTEIKKQNIPELMIFYNTATDIVCKFEDDIHKLITGKKDENRVEIKLQMLKNALKDSKRENRNEILRLLNNIRKKISEKRSVLQNCLDNYSNSINKSVELIKG